MDYPKFNISNQKEESISIQRVESYKITSAFMYVLNDHFLPEITNMHLV